MEKMPCSTRNSSDVQNCPIKRPAYCDTTDATWLPGSYPQHSLVLISRVV